MNHGNHASPPVRGKQVLHSLDKNHHSKLPLPYQQHQFHDCFHRDYVLVRYQQTLLHLAFEVEQALQTYLDQEQLLCLHFHISQLTEGLSHQMRQNLS